MARTATAGARVVGPSLSIWGEVRVRLNQRKATMSRTLTAAIAAFLLAGCTAELGRRSVEISNPPTLPADCAKRLELGRDCAVTVPPGPTAAFSDGTSTPITPAPPCPRRQRIP